MPVADTNTIYITQEHNGWMEGARKRRETGAAALVQQLQLWPHEKRQVQQTPVRALLSSENQVHLTVSLVRN